MDPVDEFDEFAALFESEIDKQIEKERENQLIEISNTNSNDDIKEEINYTHMYESSKQEVLSYTRVPYYFLLISVLISFTSFIPLLYIDLQDSTLAKSMTSDEYGDSLLASMLASIPLFLTLIADYRNFFTITVKRSFKQNEVDLESKKRLWLSQAVILTAVFIPGVYLYRAFASKQTPVPAELYVSFMLFKIYNSFGCNMFILSSFFPEIFTSTRSSLLLGCYWISRLLLVASQGESRDTSSILLANNVFLIICVVILFILMILCALKFAYTFMSKNATINLLPEEYVALFYLLGTLFLFVAGASAVFVYEAEEMANSNSTCISVYEYVAGIYTFIIVILPSRMSNLQITHSSQLKRAIEHEEKLNIELWNQRLPPKIASAVLKGATNNFYPEIYDDVTIFSSNVVDFDRKTMRSNPIDVVNILNELYFIMDFCLLKFNLYKLDIIGDVYVCAAGVTSQSSAHQNAALIADFSLLVKECVKLIKFPKSADAVRLTIGINSGKSTGAVVGNLLPRFCLFGNAINIANFLELSGQSDNINCSSTTAKLLREHGHHIIEEGSGFVAKDKARKTYIIKGVTRANTRLTTEYVQSIKQEAKQALKETVKNRKISFSKV